MLEVQFSVDEGGRRPVPDGGSEFGEFEALLATVTFPETPVVPDGVKVTFSVTTCPGVMICPLDTPLAVKPAPVIVTVETVILTLPELVKVTG